MASAEDGNPLLPSISFNESTGSADQGKESKSNLLKYANSNTAAGSGGIGSQSVDLPNAGQKARTKKLRVLDVKSHQHPWDVSWHFNFRQSFRVQTV